MKKSFLLFSFSVCVLLLNAQNTSGSTIETEKKQQVNKPIKSAPATTKIDANQGDDANLKAHKCSASCTKSAHVYLHGEKGHKCGAACIKKMSKTHSSFLKEHACSPNCKEGQHVFVHGEKGHSCTAECSKSKDKSSVTPEKMK